MLYARVQFAGYALAEVGVGGCRAVDARMPSMTRDVETVSPRGARFATYADGRNTACTVKFVVARSFASAADAENFEFAEAARLAKISGGGLRYDTDKNTYLTAKDAQLSAVEHERKGVGIRSTYTFACGRIIADWRLLVALSDGVGRLALKIGGKNYYPTTRKI